jgi:hypothetical protein
MQSAVPANIRVAVRVRPLNHSELYLNGPLGKMSVVQCIKSSSTQTTATLCIDCASDSSNNQKKKYFTVDAFHGPNSNQSDVFESAREIVEAVTSGYNGTLVAYGQTGK